MPSDFFISHTERDRQKAAWIARALVDAGFSVRFAPWELSAGDDIADWMIGAMEDCDRMIAVCSPDYFSPEAVYSERERRVFFHDGRSITPVIVRGVELPRYLRPFLRVNLTGVDEAAARERLLAALAAPQPFDGAFTPVPHADETFEREPDGGGAAMQPNTSYFGWTPMLILGGAGYGTFAGVTGFDPTDRLFETNLLLGVAVVLYGALFSLVGIGLSDPPVRRRLGAALMIDRGGQLYRTTLNRALDAVDRIFSYEERAAKIPADDWRVAWSPRLFEGCLKLALFYPVLSVYLVWAVVGGQAVIGEQEMTAEDTPAFLRVLSVFALLAAFCCGSLCIYWRRRGRLRLEVVFRLAAGVAVGVVALGVTHEGQSDNLPLVYTALALLTAATASFAACLGFVSMVLLGGAFLEIAEEVGYALVIAPIALMAVLSAPSRSRTAGWGRGRFAALAGSAAGLAIVSALALALDFDLTDDDWALVLVLAAGLLSWPALVEPALEAGPAQTGRRGAFYALYAVVLAVAMTVFTLTRQSMDIGEFMLFVAFLPLLNVVFDWLSLGLTRYCLRQGAKPGWLRPLAWSAIDLVAAVALFLGLLASAILVVHYVRAQDGDALTDLNEIFVGVAADPGSYWWLYITLMSTLLPTLLHLSLACFSLFALAPAPLQRAMAGAIAQMDRRPLANLAARAGLPALMTLSLLAPIAALYGLWHALHAVGADIGWLLYDYAFAIAESLDPDYVAFPSDGPAAEPAPAPAETGE